MVVELRTGVPAKQLSLADDGRIQIELKNRWKDGTRSILLKPHDFMVRLAALIPLPRHAIQRYHGIFAPNSRLRGAIVPAGAAPSTSRRRTMAKEKARAAEPLDLSPSAMARAAERTSSRMCWAEAWKRAFGKDLLDCECGGHMQGSRPRIPGAASPRAIGDRGSGSGNG